MNELELLKKYDRVVLDLSSIQEQIHKVVEQYLTEGYYDKEYKKFQKGTKVVECKYDYCLDDGDYAWLVNGIEAYGYENMILETLKQLNS